MNDGAGALVVASEHFARERGLDVLATIVGRAYVADEFAYLARTPAGAGNKVLEEAGKAIDDVKRIEVNEAFSSVALNSLRMLDADPETVNVNGGAVALDYPIGASGARILSTLIYELRRNGGGLGKHVHLLRRPRRRPADRVLNRPWPARLPPGLVRLRRA